MGEKRNGESGYGGVSGCSVGREMATVWKWIDGGSVTRKRKKFCFCLQLIESIVGSQQRDTIIGSFDNQGVEC